MDIVGGVYKENCLSPDWHGIYGSGGRAALAICEMGVDVILHTFLPDDFKIILIQESKYCKGNLSVNQYETDERLEFNYTYGLAHVTPPKSNHSDKEIFLKCKKALIFGMIECKTLIEAEYAVYDPQSTFKTLSFKESGSSAKHLALVLNESEAAVLASKEPLTDPKEIIFTIAENESAEVVVLKRGPAGAIVYHNGIYTTVPAYMTDIVWKIGSGDCFSAYFAYNWLELKLPPEICAFNASLATSYYCQTQCFPSDFHLNEYHPKPVIVNNTARAKVYIAGPIFTLAQLWIIEQLRNNFMDMGLDVFSPYHDVGLINNKYDIYDNDITGIEEADIIFAIIDGLDSGTIFEIGFATAKGKKVIIYNENVSEKDLVMFSGENTEIVSDFVTAIYKTIWLSLCITK
ncbi:nucleoside 2-deoxyribosyltransferase [Affinibrenneria salicis]|uniref:Nucleoside 2-deoxyribosyltransferase n=1 Tax=Affinibrenneria salicis TaxID=2590031 RepID=A0A5J5G1Q1_9GAMM|nr:PfkB family carbohydrate kinase [Affinibrenneria salicis]KAA9000460.1 nucleoside 2-deoxyribosyltransferase [Affinibrenneria salicis]